MLLLIGELDSDNTNNEIPVHLQLLILSGKSVVEQGRANHTRSYSAEVCSRTLYEESYPVAESQTNSLPDDIFVK